MNGRDWSQLAAYLAGGLMMDVIYVGVLVLFFVVCKLYVRLCERM